MAPNVAGRTVVLATNNAKKLVELRRLVASAGADVTVLGLGDLPPYPEPAETERSFVGNALLKARACVAATGLPALADDSGLAVDVLNGMPGVRSARWSGPDATDASNNALLLAQLDDVDDPDRTGHFEAAVALVLPDGRERTTTGRMDGRLLRAPVGENGFGYDPLFVATGYAVTTAEMPPADKDRISHRGQAVRAMVPVLLDELAKEVQG
ncbi:non-canonical purine NTP pyrophosphatase [Microlunatus antarcticus]|uniref:dITP/XTP pyrophosphatase n=1 Tax=Microlunatus antarcticus TaxID=53388 RepID=A0A7W5P5X1_9ACTN|nr:XTP/dITP diphosphohydrolase [Microlunatus antarcticus]